MKASNSANYGLMSQQDDQEDEWLSSQFRRIPLLLYQGWLILNLPIILLLEWEILPYWYKRAFLEGMRLNEARVIIGFTFSLYGCCQMLYAIKKKKSRIAQESFLKFQYALIGSASQAYFTLCSHMFDQLSGLNQLKILYMIFSPVVHAIGGFVVLGVFKKNHPLVRLRGSQASEERNQDFLEQNQAIASEFSKYDKELNRWPYVIYKWLLKISVFIELFFLLKYTLPEFHLFWQMSEKLRKDRGVDIGVFMYFFLIEGGISSLLNAYSCFQMEIGVKTRNLAKLQSAIVLFKTCIVLTIIKCLFVGKYANLDDIFKEDQLWWLAIFVLVPVLSLIGALRALKIIEERDKFVKVSSYSQDAYL